MMKTILVTGGNRGIGLEICRQLAGLGHRVILCSRNIDVDLAAHIMRGYDPYGYDQDGYPAKLILKQLDVTNESSIQALFEVVRSEFGRLDVLINNAGISTSKPGKTPGSKLKEKLRKDFPGIWKLAKSMKPFLVKMKAAGPRGTAATASLEDAHKIMETNFYGPWRMIQAFLPLLEKSDDPRIVNISSGQGELASLDGYLPAYSLSKASLNALTIMFSRELLPKGVKVNAMCPGWVRTDMGGPDAPRSVQEGADTAVWLATAESIPTGKFFRDRKEIGW